ncbi:hypothetical protein BVE84_10130 [Streptococcus azizii]|uniref:Uncharacterized protein n=1 Tax=Streptococcus azizii TaxID=1579424 RepID=A0AB36JLM2_9STRE|nr:hypothetical protein [Streptococcus azizii]ONK25392.1 hypothetical protein BVE86_10405 [Streptococcus azizii]ONK25412.1 hypothetical protein BVE85_10145 [Streptococcus azizii]ONK25541.1 hypothetical protein BVE84_10130 [Streptococcus azizii]
MNRIFQLFEMSKIEYYHLDFLHNEFILEVNNDLFGLQKAIFKEVSTFYFIHDQSESRKKIYSPYLYKDLETSDIGLLNQNVTIRLISDSIDWVSEYSGGGNIFIEIWDQLLILEAKRVSINGIEYILT